MRAILPQLLLAAGIVQTCVLVASAIVPVRLDWSRQLAPLPKLTRQLFWVYGGYVVLAILGLGLIVMINATELASGSLLARSICGYLVAFWGIRLALQWVLDARPYLTAWWLWAGEGVLTLIFVFLTGVYLLAALWP
ncbi:MAG TPA: hypothetical protein VMP01_03575 [Pirellulaceae bacterium]|nr:hypothetical protein [Pirellulaceae bacterium]